MATIEDFFDFVGTNDIPQNARIYVSDMSGQIHDIGDVQIEPPVIELNFAGRVTFISDSSRFSFNRLTPGAVYDAVHDDESIYCPYALLLVELYNPGEEYSIDGFAIVDPPDNDYTYLIFE